MNLPELKLNAFGQKIREEMEARGWHYNRWEVFPTAIALFHSELSEALTAYRNQKEDPKWRESVAEELADAIIRILDFSAGVGLDLEEAIIEKFKIDCAREYRYKGRII